MTTKTFELTVPFREVEIEPGILKRFPIVTVGLVQSDGNRIALPLLFDTGATVTTLRDDLFPLLGLSSWDEGTPQPVATAGGAEQAYQYDATLFIFGKELQCPVNLLKNTFGGTLFVGLFGRDGIFDQFGFGFWEGSNELLVTLNP